MSPRAAVRLRQLGFRRVHDYAGGKSDWIAAGLPVEGQGLGPMAADALERDVPTCALEEPVAPVLARLGERWPSCVVVDEHATVLGLLRRGAAGATAADAMEPGPTTVRASQPLQELLDALRQRPEPIALVTDPDGRLLGAVRAG